MPEKKDGKLRRRHSAWFWSIGFVVLQMSRLSFASRWLDAHPTVQAVFGVVIVLVAVVAIVKWAIEIFRRRRDRLEARATGRWPAGRPHIVALDAHCNGSRTPATLAFESGGLRVDPALDLVPEVIPFADVTAVRVRSAWIEVETRSWTFRVIPDSYEGRRHLLWEFALHSNEAVERGIDHDAASAAPHEPQGVAETTPAAEAPSLGSGIQGLGSALAGPMDRGNPAPPRKSGLGVGLFVAPDDDAK